MSRTILPQTIDDSKSDGKTNIRRSPRDADHPFTMISNEILSNTQITAKAKWILIYALSKPDYWELREKDIVNNTKDGPSAIHAGLNELCDAGYLHKVTSRAKDGKFDNVYYEVSETPIFKGQEEEKKTVVETTDNSTKKEISHKTSSRARKPTTDNRPYSNIDSKENTYNFLKNRFFSKPPTVDAPLGIKDWYHDLAKDNITELSTLTPIWLESMGCSPDHLIKNGDVAMILLSIVQNIVPDKKVTCFSYYKIIMTIGFLDMSNRRNSRNPYQHLSSRFLLSSKVIAHAISISGEHEDDNPYQVEWELRER